MALAPFRNMPSAVPGIGECRICMEVVPCVKVLDCSHSLCIQCANKVSDLEKGKIVCPECRKSTDVTRGLNFLRTQYFGEIRCDVCLERKPAEDMWWCAECFHALCSKCSIKEHTSKTHTISEWNKFEPVKFSVNYLEGVKFARQLSSSAEHNKKAVNIFMTEVGNKLERLITEQPEVEELKSNLLTRYGARFSSDESQKSRDSNSESELAPKVVAKVLQLAGANILEAVLPTLQEQKFQVYFTVTPEEVAEYLKSKIEFIPLEGSGKDLPSTSSASPPPPPETSFTEEIFSRPQTANPVIQVCYNPKDSVVALRTVTEIMIFHLGSEKSQSIPMPSKQAMRSMMFDNRGDGELVIALQSLTRKYEWSMEAYQTKNFPVTSVYSANFDIDPEDKVETVYLALCSDGNGIYEIRLCANNVSEIWKGICSKKKGKTKLSESLVYEKPGSRFTAAEVKEMKHGKEKYIFCWDELSSCLYRLIINKNGRCELSTKVMHSIEPIPFRLDADMHLWLFDPHTKDLCVSRFGVLTKTNVIFSQVSSFDQGGLCGIWLLPEAVFGLQIDKTGIRKITFKKTPKST